MNMNKIYWPTTIFLISTALFALVATPIYVYYFGTPPYQIVIFALVFAALTNLSITTCYHRELSHKSYEAHPLVKLIFLLIGASAWQGSALKWSSDHRKHHAHVDGEDDPYSISKGFWYAHIGWLLWKESVDQPIHAPDLQRDRLVFLQDKYYMPLAIMMSFGVPTFFGLLFDAPFAGFLFAGVIRVIATQQSTFFVNSLAHTHGKQNYCDNTSARDSILVAFLTHGEGYHSFHHRFQVDYRNGIRWYHWDPTKWTIWMMSAAGLAKRLRRISDQEILKARLNTEEFKLKAQGFSNDTLAAIQAKILSAQASVKNLRDEMTQLKADMSMASQARYQQLKNDLQVAKHEFKYARRQWKYLLRQAKAYG